MKIAIMQPYIFPYVGYFQMVSAVDKFVFYEDVNYIKNGWINRNRILINHQAHTFTINLKKASPFKLINEIEIDNNLDKVRTSISLAYKKAPYYHEVWPVIEQVLTSNKVLISDLAILSVEAIAACMGINTVFERSSVSYAETKSLERADRLIAICKANNSAHYINAIGGIELYSKEFFNEQGVKLDFIKSQIVPYKQYKNEFVAGLSIIDVLMFNDKLTARELIKTYSFVE